MANVNQPQSRNLRSAVVLNEPDYMAPLPDDEDVSENQPKSRRLMEWAEDNCEKVGSHEYVRLADIVGDLAALERKFEKLKQRIIEYDGESASILAPSNDDQPDPNDFASSSDGLCEEDSDDAVSNVSSNSSDVSTNESGIGDLIRDKNRSECVRQSPSSGYFIKYMSQYYAVPTSAIVRNYKPPALKFSNVQTIKNLTSRGKRTMSWRGKTIPSVNIIVIAMNDRADVSSFYWCVTLACETSIHADDHRVLNLLPDHTVRKIYHEFMQDEIMRHSQLVTKFKPACIEFRNVVAPPIPGKSRKLDPLHGDVYQNDYEVGNYWPIMKRSRKLDVVTAAKV